MERRTYASMAIMAGLGILVAGVAVIAMRSGGGPKSETAFDAVLAATDLIRMRIDGQDSGSRRRALKSAARQLPDSPLARALAAFADGDLEAAAREPASVPFGYGLRGWVLFELGRRAEAAEDLNRALDQSQPEWELRPLFEAALRKTR